MAKHNKGFTILELFIVILILGLVMAFAGPQLGVMIKRNQISSDINDFVAAQQFAKAEAAARLNPVTLCQRSTDGSDCVTSGDWNTGWIVFSDNNGNAAVDAADADAVLLAHDPLDENITFRGASDDVRNSITYQPSGTSSVTGTTVLIMCDDRGFADSARGVLVTITGRGSVVKASDTGENSCL